ncbi:flagellar basal-body rod protein FlgF [Geomonas nitrogeniifigens]|uniref:flagellar basal-body rod protein FlgF n=1 Tax=Geomonas diazotrophica TaxID=2843197 RepID=UPI001C2BBDDF|nr:flagellar basal-body rod protein FlgF [Geomonas nitrogeniifigens]QXE86225.1 flagellar basal-body rod protein FlgF [Geomonas nitrogeniifigens]
MNAGMYAALTGNLSAQRRLDVISNNLANASTTGFKADQIQFESVLANVKNSTQGPVFSNDRYSTDYSAGSLQRTDNSFDVALEGDGFFVVNTPQGTAYTRQGNFHLGSNGRLVTADGYEVQGGGGPITVPGNGKVEIGSNGQVSVNGNAVGTISTADFAKPYALNKLGNGLFQPADPNAATTVSTAGIKQGYLETSNVKAVVEMSRLIEASRYFEICAKAVKTYDDLTARAANDLGKV